MLYSLHTCRTTPSRLAPQTRGSMQAAIGGADIAEFKSPLGPALDVLTKRRIHVQVKGVEIRYANMKLIVA